MHGGARDSIAGSMARNAISPFTYAAPLIKSAIKSGNLQIVYNGETAIEAGDGSGPLHVMRISDPAALMAIITKPDPGLGEAWMDEGWSLDRGDLSGFLKMLMRNSPAARDDADSLMVRAWKNKPPHKTNGEDESRNNASHHYDIGNDLYASFLDQEMNYSCAFFDSPDMTLEQAQSNKLSVTINRLKIEPGMDVLDIGCGWGALCKAIGRETKAGKITGITLAADQHAYANASLSLQRERICFLLEDYRDHARRNRNAYHRIASIGMFEHVGARHFADFFAAVREMLAEDGRALIHTILRPSPGGPTSVWIDKYIFPGGCIPWLPEMLEAAEAEGMRLAEKPYIHDSSHYARTLRHWRRNFYLAWPALDARRYDLRFKKMWEFYLASCEAGFEALGFHVGQMVFEKDR